MRPREIVYLIAPSGHPNYGDELILRSWLRLLARVRPDADVVVDCHTPGQAAVLHRDSHPNVTFVDTAWRISVEAANLPLHDAVGFAETAVNEPGVVCSIVSGIELLARADTVHLVGGGYINALWPHHAILPAIANAAVARSGGRAVATGQGLIPLGDADRFGVLREQMARFALFDVRDEASRAAVAATSCTGDDAWLGIADTGVYDAESVAGQREYIFCLQADLMDSFADGAGVDGLVGMVEDLVAQWDIRGEQIAFVECIPGADRTVYDRVAHLVPGNVFVPFTDVWWRGLPARREQTWISSRFHPHLVAAAAGARGVAVTGGSEYYPTKHRSLIDAGSGWRCHTRRQPPARPVDGNGFDRRTVTARHAEKVSLAASIYPSRRGRVMRGRTSPTAGSRSVRSR